MYEKLIKEYVLKLTEEDIEKYAKKKGITITDEEIKTIYMYIKNYWKEFLKGNPNELFLELKEKLSKDVYEEVLNLYNEYKNKIKNFKF